jgi:hypothetical protein
LIYRRTGAQQRGASEAKQDALDMGKQHLDSQRTMALGLRQEAIMSTVMSATEDTPLDRVKRTVLQKFDVADGSYEAVVEWLEIGPDVVMDRHSHSGPRLAICSKEMRRLSSTSNLRCT